MSPSRIPPNLTSMKRSEPGMDWLDWSLQFSLGLFVGAAVGAVIALWMIRLRSLGFEEIYLVIAAGALIAGAFTSYHGHGSGAVPSFFDPEPPAQTRGSRACSLLIGGLGVGFFIFALYRHMSASGWQGGYSSWTGQKRWEFWAGAVVGLSVLFDLWSGRLLGI
jgi:hypothetical protein